MIVRIAGVPHAAPRCRRAGRPRAWPDPSSRAVVLLFGAWVLGVLALTAPHLVHHAFDPDGGADCAFANVAHHAPGTISDPVRVVEPLPVQRMQPEARTSRYPHRKTIPSATRGPPPVAPTSPSV